MAPLAAPRYLFDTASRAQQQHQQAAASTQCSMLVSLCCAQAQLSTAHGRLCHAWVGSKRAALLLAFGKKILYVFVIQASIPWVLGVGVEANDLVG